VRPLFRTNNTIKDVVVALSEAKRFWMFERQIETVEVLKMKINKAKLISLLISVMALLLAGGAKVRWR